MGAYQVRAEAQAEVARFEPMRAEGGKFLVPCSLFLGRESRDEGESRGEGESRVEGRGGVEGREAVEVES